jgi:arylsulfatase A-like enzyme
LPVCHLDIYPTLLDATGLDKPGGYQLDGKSILPTLEGDPQKELSMRPLFWHFPIYLQAGPGLGIECRDTLFRTRPGSVIRVGKWKMHHYFEDDGIELYKLNKDIGERKDLAKKRKRKAEELLGILNSWREETGAPVPVELNPEFISSSQATNHLIP